MAQHTPTNKQQSFTDDLIAFHKPRSQIAENFRMLRTNIQYSSPDKPIRTISITSSGPSEGKTFVISNFGIVLSDSGNKVLLIDCDLRKPKLHKMFAVSNKIGLTNYLVDNKDPDELIAKDLLNKVDLLASGPIPPNPSELLSSKKFEGLLAKLKESYDYILIDTPPCSSLTDASIIGRISDGIVLVAASAQVHIDAAKIAKENLDNIGANILGVVLNKINDESYGYYNYYYYNYYYASYGTQETEDVMTKKARRKRKKKDD